MGSRARHRRSHWGGSELLKVVIGERGLPASAAVDLAVDIVLALVVGLVLLPTVTAQFATLGPDFQAWTAVTLVAVVGLVLGVMVWSATWVTIRAGLRESPIWPGQSRLGGGSCGPGTTRATSGAHGSSSERHQSLLVTSRCTGGCRFLRVRGRERPGSDDPPDSALVSARHSASRNG